MVDSIFKYCFFITILLGFVAAGYIFYHLLGYAGFLVTAIFIFVSILGISVYQKEIKELERRN